jgi:signal transduction histidine kinase
MRKLRATLVDIHPPSLQRAGLAAALEDLAGSLSARATEVEVTVEPDLPEQVADLMFRTAAEALRNVEKHAGATHVWVSAERNGSVATLTVRDDGTGFDPATSRGDDHMGLLLLEDLAAAAGGRLELRSAPGDGTTVLLEVPL